MGRGLTSHLEDLPVDLDEYKESRTYLENLSSKEKWFSFNDKDKEDYTGEYYLLTNLSRYFKYKYRCRMSTNGIIYGKKFHGRGFEYRETEWELNNPLHNLRNDWWTTSTNSAWIKYRHNKKATTKFDISKENEYGINESGCSSFALLNFCIELDLPSEKLLHGVKIASITTIQHSERPVWKTTIEGADYSSLPSISLPYVRFTNDDDNNGCRAPKSRIFIPFTDIYGSNIASFGLDDSNHTTSKCKPIRNIRNKLSNKTEKILRKEFSKDNPNEINELWLVVMNPERLSIKYNSSNNEMYNRLSVNDY
jgi:hypothetical protein